MELIAASRIIKAQQRARAAAPFSRELTRAVSAVATFSNVEHPADHREGESPACGDGGDHLRSRAGRRLLVVGDQGSAVAARAARARRVARSSGTWSAARPSRTRRSGGWRSPGSGRASPTRRPTRTPGRSPTRVIKAFLDPDRRGRRGRDPHRLHPVRLDADPDGRGHPDAAAGGRRGHRAARRTELLPLYEFEPDAEVVLDELLPLYVASRIQYCLLQSAASELASRQRAMKSATDNAQQLIERLTREANQARQAEITQEISEIVGGASALADASAGTSRMINRDQRRTRVRTDDRNIEEEHHRGSFGRRGPRRPGDRPGGRRRVPGRPDAGHLPRLAGRHHGRRRDPDDDAWRSRCTSATTWCGRSP